MEPTAKELLDRVRDAIRTEGAYANWIVRKEGDHPRAVPPHLPSIIVGGRSVTDPL